MKEAQFGGTFCFWTFGGTYQLQDVPPNFQKQQRRRGCNDFISTTSSADDGDDVDDVVVETWMQ